MTIFNFFFFLQEAQVQKELLFLTFKYLWLAVKKP